MTTENQHTTESGNPVIRKTRSTHDALVEQLTQEYPPVPVGTLQIHGGVTYRFDGESWTVNAAG